MSERDALDDFEVKFLFDSVLRQLPCDDAKMQMMLKLSHDVLVGRKSVNVATEDRSVSKALLQECVTAWKSAASRIEKGFAKAVRCVLGRLRSATFSRVLQAYEIVAIAPSGPNFFIIFI